MAGASVLILDATPTTTADAGEAQTEESHIAAAD